MEAYTAEKGKRHLLSNVMSFLLALHTNMGDWVVVLFAGFGKMKAIVIFNNLLNSMSVEVWLSVKFTGMHTDFGFESVNYGFVYVLLGIGLEIAQPLLGMLVNARSRKAEYSADCQAVQEKYGLVRMTALKKLSRGDFSHLSLSRIQILLEYSHPPLSQRIAAIEKPMTK